MEIFLYTLSVMYSPGPVNFMGLNAGVTGQFRKSLLFFIGVGAAMLLLFIIFGYVGEAVIPHQYLHYIALVGAIYTFYLAFKMLTSNISTESQNDNSPSNLTFWNGFWIQLLNPKGILVILPVTTVMYPAAHITGYMIAIVSTLISIGAAAAPFVYSIAGVIIGHKIKEPSIFNLLNRIMGVALIISGLFMFFDFIKGINIV
ncbi:LysE family transporter (plasmid) [Acinetobacter lwoffii]|jgi:cysteine/O-acetylserine efflux protein|uniref:LysE family translocator n=1 Tax=Acinetobacter lwoffii TaxID=28090 RepID=UPI001C5B4C11|nr:MULTISPECIES: LysE family transporter [Acinetobacter]QXX88268.1 LysE family transporter [Acinetobacter lwoffii]